MSRKKRRTREEMEAVATIKEKVRHRDGYECTKCGLSQEEYQRVTGRKLEVHRLVPGSVYLVEECVTLCRRCHGPEPRRNRGARVSAEGIVTLKLKPQMHKALNHLLETHVPEVRPSAVLEAALKLLLESRGYGPFTR